MERLNIIVETRKENEKTKKLLRDDYVPGVVYDQNTNSTSIKIPANEVQKLLDHATMSTLVDLSIDKKSPEIVLIQEVQRDHRHNSIRHISFMILDENREATIPVKISVIGESEAVRNNIGILVITQDNIPLKGLPKNIPPQLEADISVLKVVGDTITVSDINIPENLELVHESDKDLTLITIRPFQKAIEEEEEKPEVEGEEGEEAIEGEEGTAEGEEGTEGEEGADKETGKTEENKEQPKEDSKE